MIDPFKKARDADRDAAIEVVEAAYADGQISKPDSDLRVERLLQARTMAEIQAITRDLHQPESPAGALAAAPTDLVGSARAATPSSQVAVRPEQSSRTLVGIIVAVVIFMVIAGVGVAGALFVGQVADSGFATGTSQRRAGADFDLTSANGFDEFVAEVESRTDDTVVFSATIYPGYAVLEVPEEGSGQRSFGWYYDGSWDEWTGRGTASEARFDLADLDGAVVAATVKKVRRMVENPDTSYVLVNSGGRDEGVCMSAYATNEYDETAYLDATCDGEVVFRYPG